jgi:hypothetical protein
MNAQLLLDVATVLEGVPDEKFDLTYWRNRRPECGTTCCAIGHYVEAWPDRGLWFLPGHGWDGDKLSAASGAANWDAVCEHFDIGEQAALHLFAFWRYTAIEKTRAHVIARIRIFVASAGKAASHA